MKIKNKKLLIFDLDGTLIDSAPDLALSINKMLNVLQLDTFSEKEIDGWVGNGAKTLVSRALSGSVEIDSMLDETYLANALDMFLEIYAKNVCIKTVPYDGVQQTLMQLKKQGYILGIVTNKPIVFVEPILKKLELDVYFEHTLGGDSLSEKKPHPMPLEHMMQKYQVSPQESLMIGDSKNDILAAHAAEVESIGVTYGYNYGTNIDIYKPTYVVDRFSNILEYLQ